MKIADFGRGVASGHFMLAQRSPVVFGRMSAGFVEARSNVRTVALFGRSLMDNETGRKRMPRSSAKGKRHALFAVPALIREIPDGRMDRTVGGLCGFGWRNFCCFGNRLGRSACDRRRRADDGRGPECFSWAAMHDRGRRKSDEASLLRVGNFRELGEAIVDEPMLRPE